MVGQGRGGFTNHSGIETFTPIAGGGAIGRRDPLQARTPGICVVAAVVPVGYWTKVCNGSMAVLGMRGGKEPLGEQLPMLLDYPIFRLAIC